MTQPVIVPVILCGGSGTRLWPYSREFQPKQFLNLMGDFSLIQDTMRRALRVSGAPGKHLVTVTLGKLQPEVVRHLSEMDPTATQHILCEPSARNTAAAVAFAAAYVQKNFGGEAIMWVLPADHHIGDENALRTSFMEALDAALTDHLVTFGIRPSRPETGYGYVRLGEPIISDRIFKAAQFVEKPDLETARSYVESGVYLWNSGMFLFKTSAVLAEFSKHSADTLFAVQRAIAESEDAAQPVAKLYNEIPQQPFDKAIMERSENVVTVPCNPTWSDIGSWESVWEMREKDMHGNVVEGRAACYDTRNSLIISQKRLVACAGLENIVIVETDDAILIADRTNADSMKVLVNGLKKSGFREVVAPVPNVMRASKQLDTDVPAFNEEYLKQRSA